MAPNLADPQHVIIQAMIEEGSLRNDEMAKVVCCGRITGASAAQRHRTMAVVDVLDLLRTLKLRPSPRKPLAPPRRDSTFSWGQI